jgi:hypothetical protein
MFAVVHLNSNSDIVPREHCFCVGVSSAITRCASQRSPKRIQTRTCVDEDSNIQLDKQKTVSVANQPRLAHAARESSDMSLSGESNACFGSGESSPLHLGQRGVPNSEGKTARGIRAASP